MRDILNGNSIDQAILNQIGGILITSAISIGSGAGLGAILMNFRRHHIPSDVYGDHVFFKMTNLASK